MKAILYIVAAVSLLATGYVVRGIRNTLIIRSILSDIGEFMNAQSDIYKVPEAYIDGMLDMLGELQARGL